MFKATLSKLGFYIQIFSSQIMSSDSIYGVGVDLGTSTIKVSCQGFSYKIPSIIGDNNPGGWEGLNSNKELIDNLSIYDDNNRLIYVGELARLQSPIKKSLASEGRMKSIQNVILALKAALSIIQQKKGYDTFVIATGVPVASSKDQSLRMIRGMKGKHSFKIRNDSTGDETTINLHFPRAMVLPEPYGTYWQTLSVLGESKAVDAIICDIGHGSTDFLCMYKGGIMRGASGSIEEATDSLTNALTRAIQEKTGKILRPFELIKTIEEGRNQVLVGGKVMDISSAIHQATVAISDVIVDESHRLLNNLPPDAWIEKVIVCGGGAHIFGDYLKNAFVADGIVNSKEEIYVPPDPVMSNAIGFETIANSRKDKI